MNPLFVEVSKILSGEGEAGGKGVTRNDDSAASE